MYVSLLQIFIKTLHLLKKCREKIHFLLIFRANILSLSSIGFIDKNETYFKLFLNNVSVCMSPKFVKSCILLCGIELQGLCFQNEKGQSEITAENNTEFLFISDMKLFKRKHSHTIFIYKLTTFIELVGMGEIYLLFF